MKTDRVHPISDPATAMPLLEEKNTISLELPTHSTRQCSSLLLTKAQASKIFLLDHIKVNANSQKPGSVEIEFWHLPVAKDRLFPQAAEDQKGQRSGKRFSTSVLQGMQDCLLSLALQMSASANPTVSILSSFSYQQI